MRITRYMLACVILAVAAVTLVACGDDDDSASTAQNAGKRELRTVTIGLAQELTSGYYPIIAAMELGYFEDEGLEVEFDTSGGTVPMAALLQGNKAEVITPAASEAIFGLAEGADLTVVFDPWTKTAENIITIDPAIQDIQDLEGKTIGLSEEEDRAFVASALQEAGMSVDDVTMAVIGEEPAVVANTLEKGDVQAYASPFTIVALLGARGLEVRDLSPESLAATPSVSFATESGTVTGDAEMLTGLFRALAKGVWAGQVAPEAVTAMYEKVAPNDWSDPEVARATIDQVFGKYEPVDPDKIGEVIPEVWDAAEQRLLEAGELEEPVNIADAIDNQFVAPANEFDRDEVKSDADAWLEANG